MHRTELALCVYALGNEPQMLRALAVLAAMGVALAPAAVGSPEAEDVLYQLSQLPQEQQRELLRTARRRRAARTTCANSTVFLDVAGLSGSRGHSASDQGATSLLQELASSRAALSARDMLKPQPMTRPAASCRCEEYACVCSKECECRLSGDGGMPFEKKFDVRKSSNELMGGPPPRGLRPTPVDYAFRCGCEFDLQQSRGVGSGEKEEQFDLAQADNSLKCACGEGTCECRRLCHCLTGDEPPSALVQLQADQEDSERPARAADRKHPAATATAQQDILAPLSEDVRLTEVSMEMEDQKKKDKKKQSKDNDSEEDDSDSSSSSRKERRSSKGKQASGSKASSSSSSSSSGKQRKRAATTTTTTKTTTSAHPEEPPVGWDLGAGPGGHRGTEAGKRVRQHEEDGVNMELHVVLP